MIYHCVECGPKGVSFAFPDETMTHYDYKQAGDTLTSHAEQEHNGQVNYVLHGSEVDQC